MGNKANRTRRCKRNRNHILNFFKNKNSAPVSTDENTERTVVVDIVSILNSDDQHITPKTETNEPAIYDPLLVIKTEEKPTVILGEQEDELLNDDKSQVTSFGSVVTELEIEPVSNETAIGEPSNEFKNMCRLCLAKYEGHWIEIFSNEPYGDCNEITPSNIAEIIEQCTTVKVSKDDHLPNQLCEQCFLSLRFVHNFREKSISSQSSLSSMAKASRQLLSKENVELESIANSANSQPIKRLVKVIHLKRLKRKPILNAKRNFATHHAVKQTADQDKEEKGTGGVQCEICGKVFEKRQMLEYHLNRHNDVRPFACKELFCDKSFYSPANLKGHILNVHCVDPPFKCDLCEKAYTKAEKLKIHRASHFPPTIPCNICGKLLRSRASVYKHRRSHTEPKFHCNDCGKNFQSPYTLRVHRRIHTNEKPFICCKCGEAFAYNCLLKAHTERKHSD